jgi:hypothetical protein
VSNLLVTKKEVKEIFKLHLKEIGGLSKDKIGLREEWHNFVDSLHKDGHITDRQVNTWVCPF